MLNKDCLVLLLLLVFIGACKEDGPLPVLGQPKVVDGEKVPHFIPDFEFMNQDSAMISNEDLAGGIYVADFFFTHCPSICPKVTAQMIRIHEEFQDDNVTLVSYTMDPKRDTPDVLKKYAEKIEAEAPKWHFLTGDKEALHEIDTDYFSIIIEDDDVPGGFDHTGKLILVDQNRHIRAFCEGTDEDDVTEFMKDIKKLLLENEK